MIKQLGSALLSGLARHCAQDPTMPASVMRRSARLAAAAAAAVVIEPIQKTASSGKKVIRRKKSKVPVLTPESEGEEVVVTTKVLKSLPSRDMELELWEMGFLGVVGVDEAGRGPLAGPVVAAACIIPPTVAIQGVNDSKKLTAEKREQLYSQIVSAPGVVFEVCVVDASTIDEINILQATMQAMAGCINKLSTDGSPRYILVDGNRLPDGVPAETARCVIKGDSECHVIAAASILAKVTRDRLMMDYDKRWPVYGFKDHKGYGTAAHTAALLKHGPCDIHRRSFAPLKDQILKEGNLTGLTCGGLRSETQEQ